MAKERFVPSDLLKDERRDSILKVSREDRLVLKETLEPLQELPSLLEGTTPSYRLRLRGTDRKLIRGEQPSASAKFEIEFIDTRIEKATWMKAPMKSFRTYPDGSTTVVFESIGKTHIFRVERLQGKITFRFKNQAVTVSK